MTRPTESADHIDAGALHEVQDAYRALPPAEPGAMLDAQVRAAVAAELAKAGVTETSAPVATAKVIAFPWWRRASLPLAAAATLMLAVGLGRMWFVEGMSERAPDSPYQAPATVQQAAPTAGETPAAPAAPAAVETPEADAPPQRAKPSAAPKQAIADVPPAAKAAPRKSDSPVADDAVIFRGLERAAPPPAEAEAKREAAPQADSARRERSAESLNAAPAAAPAPAPIVRPAASEAPAAKAVQKRAISADMAAPLDAETFDEIRRLLRDQRPDEARALLKRWREAHPGVTLPEDLRALAAELDRAP